MNNDELIKKVLIIASETFSVTKEEININSQQKDLENWDSLGHLNLILAIEENLKVKFNSVDILKMQSIKEIVKILVNNN